MRTIVSANCFLYADCKRSIANVIFYESRECSGILLSALGKGRVTTYLPFDVELAFAVLGK